MDNFNIVVLAGRMAAPAELRSFEGGSCWLRYLVTVRSGGPRSRVDVIPVVHWNPPSGMIERPPDPGCLLWITGSVQRRFWTGPDGRRNRLEIVARQVEVRDVGAHGAQQPDPG